MGWKSIFGAIIVASSAALRFFETQGLCSGCGDIAAGVQAVGIAVLGIGLRHAIAKGK